MELEACVVVKFEIITLDSFNSLSESLNIDPVTSVSLKIISFTSIFETSDLSRLDWFKLIALFSNKIWPNSTVNQAFTPNTPRMYWLFRI